MNIGDKVLLECTTCGKKRIGVLGSRAQWNVVKGKPNGKMLDSLYDPLCTCIESGYTMIKYEYEQDLTMDNQKFEQIRQRIRNLLTPSLTLATIVLEDPTYDKLPECAEQVKKSVDLILKELDYELHYKK